MRVAALGTVAQALLDLVSARLWQPAVEVLRELVEVVPGVIAHEFLEA
jgi:hypothetical protein